MADMVQIIFCFSVIPQCYPATGFHLPVTAKSGRLTERWNRWRQASAKRTKCDATRG
ncbi:hypothetical protein JOF46_004292 [Paeniglutamicibacter psychrophenolicus]|uniref:Uncharacterized protein n=1 Tax=Paeniglutamicibacter psychrophenolicus TaxID=257454 RepID=A0ABS4WJK7_9MICC|nr:hypothetical protein [Paeniglutamicibacter psychrophenolicus]